jgi:electron transfer flavoprotein beta subunit
MKIIVCAKQVPDPEKFPTGRYRSDARLDRDAFPSSVNPIDKNAAELTLTLSPQDPVRVVTMGPQTAVTAIRDILSMGVSLATHVSDPRLAGADLLTTAKVLAAAIKKHGDFDLVVCGKQSTDAMNGSVAAMIAEILGVPSLLNVDWAEVSDGVLNARTITDAGLVTWKIQLPAVISVTKNINIPRLPSLRGMTKAMGVGIDGFDLNTLGISLEGDGLQIISQEPIARQVETVIVDGVDAGEKSQKLIDMLKEKGVLL